MLINYRFHHEGLEEHEERKYFSHPLTSFARATEASEKNKIFFLVPCDLCVCVRYSFVFSNGWLSEVVSHRPVFCSENLSCLFFIISINDLRASFIDS